MQCEFDVMAWGVAQNLEVGEYTALVFETRYGNKQMDLIKDGKRFAITFKLAQINELIEREPANVSDT